MMNMKLLEVVTPPYINQNPIQESLIFSSAKVELKAWDQNIIIHNPCAQEEIREI